MIERYDYVSLLGEGGAGTVFKAWDKRLQRYVAVKRLLPAHQREGVDVGTDLSREASALAAFQHPNVVAVHDLDFLGEEPCIIMEYINGETLQQILQRGALTLPDFLNVAYHSLEGMEAAHNMGIQHRDVKPSNFMIQWTANGKFLLKMLDFGIAEIAHRPVTKMDDGNVYGSVYYLAPEQFQSDGADLADVRTDLYSLGCVFYSALTGCLPFEGDSVEEVRDAHISHKVNPVLSQRTDLPASVRDFILKMMARKPEDRYQSTSQAKRAFVSLQNDILSAARPYSFPRGPQAKREAPQPVETITQRLQTIPSRHKIVYVTAALLTVFGLAHLMSPMGANATAALQHNQSGLAASRVEPVKPPTEKLLSWFDANQGVKSRGGKAEAYLGEFVEMWEDQSMDKGNNPAYYYSKDGSTKRPLFPILESVKLEFGFPRNSNALQFRNSNFHLISTDKATTRDATYDEPALTFVFLLRVNAGAKGVLVGAAGADSDSWQIHSQDNRFYLGRGSSEIDYVSIAHPKSDQFCILTCELGATPNSGQMYVTRADGTETGSSKTSSLILDGKYSKIRLGGKAQSSPELEQNCYWNGDLASVMVYRKALPQADRQQVTDYLRNTYLSPKSK